MSNDDTAFTLRRRHLWKRHSALFIAIAPMGNVNLFAIRSRILLTRLGSARHSVQLQKIHHHTQMPENSLKLNLILCILPFCFAVSLCSRCFFFSFRYESTLLFTFCHDDANESVPRRLFIFIHVDIGQSFVDSTSISILPASNFSVDSENLKVAKACEINDNFKTSILCWLKQSTEREM